MSDRPDADPEAQEWIQIGKVHDDWYEGHFSLRQLADSQVLTITGFPPYDGKWVRYEPPLELPTEACVIRAKVAGPVQYRILFGHPNPGENGMTFCRAIDGLGYKADEIESFEVLWVDDAPRFPSQEDAFR